MDKDDLKAREIFEQLINATSNGQVKVHWRKESKMGNERLLTDGEIRNAIKQAHDQAQEYGDDGKPLPEREVAKVQDTKTLRAVGDLIANKVLELEGNSDKEKLFDEFIANLIEYLTDGQFPESK